MGSPLCRQKGQKQRRASAQDARTSEEPQKSPFTGGQKAAKAPGETGQKVREFARFGRFCAIFTSFLTHFRGVPASG
jgi:hypothetical protein